MSATFGGPFVSAGADGAVRESVVRAAGVSSVDAWSARSDPTRCGALLSIMKLGLFALVDNSPRVKTGRTGPVRQLIPAESVRSVDRIAR